MITILIARGFSKIIRRWFGSIMAVPEGTWLLGRVVFLITHPAKLLKPKTTI
jgi:hypothetical protein